MIEKTQIAENKVYEEEAKAFFPGDDLRVRCFLDKYALKTEDGRYLEGTPREMWQRVAQAISSIETTEEKRKEWLDNFHWMLKDFKFVPGGRIMFGAGNIQRKLSLLNCYVVPIKGDSIEGIWGCAQQMAKTYAYGGGVGTDISILRPKGSKTNNSSLFSTGAVSFMELYSITTGTIGQNGRRGALMITLDVNHPDAPDFIDIKNDSERRSVRYANISLKITDEFMKAVENNEDFELGFKNDVIGRFSRKINAREMWKKLVKNAWDSAEPGMIMWDNVKKESTTEYNGMEVISTNPCSEIPLEAYGCCCLGNINLSMFVSDEYSPEARVDWPNLEKVARYGTRFLDNVLTYNADLHALQEQKDASLRSRRIGVGFTGFGDMLIKLGLKYDTEAAIGFTDDLFARIKNIVYDESVNLGIEKGIFPAFDLEKHMKSPFIQRLDNKIKERIKQHGLRNAALLTVPPTGTVAVLAGTTSGIEPIFALSYLRRSESLSKDEFTVYHPSVEHYVERFELESEEDLPDTFVTSHKIKPEFRVKMQATIQKHIDHAISSTVNLPRDIKEEEVSKIYFLAWKLGCKGITVYREGSREGILITKDEKKSEKKTSVSFEDKAAVRAERPSIVSGRTQKIITGYGNMYVTINAHDNKPFELFTYLGKSGGFTTSFTDAIGRLISLALQSGIPASSVVEQLRGIRSPMISWDNGTKIYSVPDAIALALERETDGNFKEVQTSLPGAQNPTKPDLHVLIDNGHSPECPSCGSMLQASNGCMNCMSCGWTKCD